MKSFWFSRKESSCQNYSFFYSDFNYGPLLWMFSHKKSLIKLKDFQKRALRLLNNDFVTPYDALLNIPGLVTVELKANVKPLC